MDNNFNITNIEKSLEINYLSNLIKACEKNGINKELLEEKLLKLNEINTTEVKQSTIKKNTSNLSLNNTESPTSQQFSDDYLYLKPWAKLTAIHKIIKIKEFVNMLLIKNETDKDELKEKLIDMVKNKIITKKDSVLYDSTKGKIISIPNLQYVNGKYLIL
jgi:hypothetical protein